MNRLTTAIQTSPRLLGALSALALLAGAPTVVAAQDEDSDVQAEASMTKGEQRLAKMLEGRVAGEPQTCIRTIPTQQITTIEGTAYVYGRGNTIYVQRTRSPEAIDRSDTLVVRRFNGSQLCRQDVATTVDPVNGFFIGVVQFADFVPYTRVDDDG